MKEKKEKNIVNPNPDLNRCAYNFNRSVGASLNELNEGYAFYYCYSNKEPYQRIKEKRYKQDTLKNQIKTFQKHIQEYNNQIRKIQQDINNLEDEIKEMEEIINITDIQDTKPVRSALRQVKWLIISRKEKLEDDTVKHWNVKKIGFEEVKTIADKENVPVRAVIQGINPNDLKTHFKGVNKYLK